MQMLKKKTKLPDKKASLIKKAKLRTMLDAIGQTRTENQCIIAATRWILSSTSSLKLILRIPKRIRLLA